MSASRFGEVAPQIGVLVGCAVMLHADGHLFVAGLVLGVGSVFWYVSKGMHLDGWSGRAQRETEAELGAVEAALQKLDALPDSPEKHNERLRLDRQRQTLRQQLDDYSRSPER